MPDLSSRASHDFWVNYQDNMLYRVISFMESMEDWTLDGDPKLENAIQQLGKALDDIGEIEMGEENNIMTLCGSIKTSRCLRLLMCLDTAYPGAAAKVLMHAEDNTESDEDTAGIFLRRNIVFERLRLLGRVFAEDRFKLVTKALEESSYD